MAGSHLARGRPAGNRPNDRGWFLRALSSGTNAVVIGGGVIGCSIAYFLQRAGLEVTLIERGRIGSGASAAAAGMLAPSAESVSAGPLQELARAGLDAFERHHDEIAAESGIDFEYRRDGVLRIAESDVEAAELHAALQAQSKQEPSVRWLDSRELQSLEPNLTPNAAGAVYAADDPHVNPLRLTQALASAAVRRGVRLMEGCSVESVERTNDEITAVRCQKGKFGGDYFVFANGAWAGLWGESLGTTTPVFPVRGQMAALVMTPPPIRHVVYSRAGYLVPKADGSVYVGATEEPGAGYDASVTASGLRWLLAAAERLVPVLGDSIVLRSWAGLRPGSPDRLPLLGPLHPFSNLTLACGHFRNGILFSLVTGELLAQQISQGRELPQLARFSPARFLHA